MALEIRELVVKVNVTEGNSPKEGVNHLDMKKIIDECTRKVMKELKHKRKR